MPARCGQPCAFSASSRPFNSQQMSTTMPASSGAGHWNYDLNRHLGLWSAYKAQLVGVQRAPERLRRTAPVAPGRVNERA